jgi:ribose/xylose/arabinose/galactoside ABC-type transport system permease subunit
VAALAGVISCIVGLKFPNMNTLGGIVIIIASAAAVGGVCGLFNGIVITQFNVVPMITTLATMTMARGLTYIVTGGTAVFGLPAVFSFLGAGRLIKNEA